MNDLVSIIIPIFNREKLIMETLDSVSAQSYTNWECLIIDDGSSDNTLEVLNSYVIKDTRFKIFTRPRENQKGANACRNIGLKNAQGSYVIFFDSDDLMTGDHVMVKIKGILASKSDFVITRTEFFNSDNNMEAYYQFGNYKLTPYNYVAQKLNWLTLDVCIKIEIAKQVNFNEHLQSGQEYNYFCKLLHISVNGKFIDKTVSLRRSHENSVRHQLKSKKKEGRSYLMSSWITYLELKNIANRSVRLVLFNRCIDLIHLEKWVPQNDYFSMIAAAFKEYKFRGAYFVCMIFSLILFKRTHYFRNKLRVKD